MAPIDLDFDSLRPPSSVMTVDHDVWRERVRLFVEETIRPNLKDWDKEGPSQTQCIWTLSTRVVWYWISWSLWVGKAQGKISSIEYSLRKCIDWAAA